MTLESSDGYGSEVLSPPGVDRGVDTGSPGSIS